MTYPPKYAAMTSIIYLIDVLDETMIPRNSFPTPEALLSKAVLRNTCSIRQVRQGQLLFDWPVIHNATTRALY